ncbi:tRNA uridine-5-carboxymethylaminomethyl(34) synthesis enzyme MnmG [Candidatus Epulonipiscium fishelsonii]|uniref:tRNA uridine-5-carboxymethylaminomethyl(34) synthesis enzyme MnmG n=1 Tax=Candidatus Epulonipiscium fishelsonii TaxID=77094 RepID=A0ACC8XAC7_9FIRM|nr:tRNA uridine-5-carboxymethylaminomethyl(34) synthesis enzyme MnmG [Epulopiscium sp. SCG-B11WGA-EpuloA1]ONI40142.1 tRNA uridine-5-carboxymethylaminomethyl(34) synthesis enzyme MnmG [Epulopiscium sp. SCG-B05WGA-EpuloA1]
MQEIDVAVIGAGHAGCEASLASARLGKKTIMFTMSFESIAMMPCNPNIGGTSKGHLVKEIDALGGEMGKNIDKSYIQSKMLNTAKGPAVHSLRAQADKAKYMAEMKKVLENTDNLLIKQQEIVKIILEDDKVVGILTNTGTYYKCKAVILASGTYIQSRCLTGENIEQTGPNGLKTAKKISESLKEIGIELRRFKTGTPARVDGRTVDVTKMEPQYGDLNVIHFSFDTDKSQTNLNQVACYLTYTNEQTHKIIRDNLSRSPLYSGVIEGTGPRYCPSIEDKVVRFNDKERHQVFLEPEGYNTNEMYVQGMSSSLPEDVQIQMLRSIKGLENVEVTRIGYAIEYDCINPLQLKHTLEFKHIDGLFSAGQMNGSSGYEEAGAQGLVAGINAVLKIDNRPPFTIDRSEGYIGVLIDDLVTKGTNEPYRMLTSRAEYRLLLRQDNADLRLTEKGYDLGLISEERFEKFKIKRQQIDEEINRLKKVFVGNSENIQAIITGKGSNPLKSGIALSELLKRKELEYHDFDKIDITRPKLSDDIIEQVITELKYEGYISRQQKQVEQFKKLEKKIIPENIDYNKVHSLRIEAAQKLTQIKPVSIGQASRISGVSPADISVLLVYLEQLRGRQC